MDAAGADVKHPTQDMVGISVENSVENDVVTSTGKVYLSPGRVATSTTRKELRTTPKKLPTHKQSNIRRRTDNADNSSGTQHHSLFHPPPLLATNSSLSGIFSVDAQPSDGIESINVDDETLIACMDILDMDKNEDVLDSADINLFESGNPRSQSPPMPQARPAPPRIAAQTNNTDWIPHGIEKKFKTLS